MRDRALLIYVVLLDRETAASTEKIHAWIQDPSREDPSRIQGLLTEMN
jgi:hypothetical protein